MRIEKLQCRDFRNYEKVSVEFDRGINFFYGDNAQGKTNLLEAVYICSSTRSHRGRDEELIRFGCGEAHIRADVEKQGISHRIDIHYKKNQKKGAAVDGKSVKKASELLGYINVVFFSPEDLDIIKRGPAERRRFIDRELCQMDSFYMKNLAAYNRALENRNKLLRDIYTDKKLGETLDIWDEQLVRYGSAVIKDREKYLSETEKIMKPVFEKLTGGEEIGLIYQKNSEADSLLEDLKKNRERDLYLQQTSRGPHRDDLSVLSDGRELKNYGSQGQIRSAAITLKLSEIKLIKKYRGEYPILLLDDVMSELDTYRQKYLLEEINDTQTLITATGPDAILKENISVNKKFHVSKGTIQEI